ncbi:MAG: nuclear transport factor 2 family protein [Hyphomicrobiales bacterium]
MTAFDPCAALQRYHAALEARDLASVAAMLAEDVVYESVGLGLVQGKANLLGSLASYFRDHPDHHAWDTDVKAEGPLEALALWGLDATDPKTGDPIERHGSERVSFTASGLISRILVEDFRDD